jgi:hypothetical protein
MDITGLSDSLNVLSRIHYEKNESLPNLWASQEIHLQGRIVGSKNLTTLYQLRKLFIAE